MKPMWNVTKTQNVKIWKIRAPFQKLKRER